MRDELWTQLNGFTQSLGCVPVVDVDGGISNMAIGNPNCETTFDVTITLANFGIQDLTNPTITLSNGGTQQITSLLTSFWKRVKLLPLPLNFPHLPPLRL